MTSGDQLNEWLDAAPAEELQAALRYLLGVAAGSVSVCLHVPPETAIEAASGRVLRYVRRLREVRSLQLPLSLKPEGGER